MAVALDLPADDDLEAQAREALGVECYRRRKLTHAQLSKMLGLSRFETDAVLKKHGVYYDITSEDVRRESEELRALRSGDDHRR
jgi:predicted HTH domain antitoxin